MRNKRTSTTRPHLAVTHAACTRANASGNFRKVSKRAARITVSTRGYAGESVDGCGVEWCCVVAVCRACDTRAHTFSG